MPTLNWIGKEAVVKHHKDVPYRLLEPVPELSCGDSGSGNLIVQGDNLHALKALLPRYAGQVKCIYIDPPYNTGNENWVYNDNVNSPEIRRWLGEVTGKEGEDLSRHDKWLSMMYPRLSLLKQFLSIDGIIAVSIDDAELNDLGILLDELFGPKKRLACAPWLAEPSGGKEKTGLRGGHEYIFIYHNGDDSNISREIRSTGELNLKDKWGKYRKGRELRKWGGISRRSDRLGQWYPLCTPDGTEVWPIRNDGEEGHWRWGKEQLMKPILEDPDQAHWEIRPFDEGVTWQGKRERWVPYEKIRDAKKSIGWSTWLDSYGFNADATRELKEIFGKKLFDTPKPSALIRWLVSLHADENALVMDSFAGSGTTGHAVLQLNSEDGGNRHFILVEMDDNIARNVTAERVRRVSQGYTNAKGERVEGLGGGFQFCKLSEEPLFTPNGPVRSDVTFAQLAEFVWFVETGTGFTGKADSPLIGIHEGCAVYLLYNGILKDRSVAGGNVLTGPVYESLSKFDGPKVIYAAACRLGAVRLAHEGIVFKQTPYALEI
jgi:adenine-specific DNA-methyltransferase